MATDPYVGRLTFFRVYSGSLKSGSYVYNSTKDKRERIGRLLQMHANKREEIKEVYAGDIAAAVGLRASTTGDTLCTEDSPVIHVAVEPKSKADQDKMGMALNRLQMEDPSFRVHTDEETGQTIIGGMGELHLEILVDRMFREFKVEANVGKPQVAYRETITKQVESEGRYIRQTGGRGQYGHCKIRIYPREAGAGFEFVNKIVGGVVPREYVPAIEKGIKEAMEHGITAAGYPVVDVGVELYDGSYHDVDSSELSFKLAARKAFKAAMQEAKPALLEPIMNVEIQAPVEYAGDLMGDLNGRRGRIGGMETRGNTQILRAQVPMAEMLNYQNDLTSMTQGRASFTMEFDHYDFVPQQQAEKIISAAKAARAGEEEEEE